jgi:hypothetical protein
VLASGIHVAQKRHVASAADALYHTFEIEQGWLTGLA